MSSSTLTEQLLRQHQQQQQQQQQKRPRFLQDLLQHQAANKRWHATNSQHHHNKTIHTKASLVQIKQLQQIGRQYECDEHACEPERRYYTRSIRHHQRISWTITIFLMLLSGIQNDGHPTSAASISPNAQAQKNPPNVPQSSINADTKTIANPNNTVTDAESFVIPLENERDNTSSHNTLQSFSIIDEFALNGDNKMDEMDFNSLISDRNQPVFDFGLTRNITGRTGQAETIIKCRVDQLNDKSVSWIRKRDLHILTVGNATYTSDKRFEVTESKDSREWLLHVKSPQPRDSGIYECQVNTEPKMSMAFHLNIIEISPDARAIITGPADLHFKTGSAIILNCIVDQPSIKDIGPIYWYRGSHLITPIEDDNELESDTTDVVVNNQLLDDFDTRIAMESELGDTLRSRLRISNARTTDTGNYTCQPTTASGTSVMVHVINDEKPAAMQKSSASSYKRSSNFFNWLLYGCLMLLCATFISQLFTPLIIFTNYIDIITLAAAVVVVLVAFTFNCDEVILILITIIGKIVNTFHSNFWTLTHVNFNTKTKGNFAFIR